MTSDEIEETINAARGFLADRESPTYGDKGIAGEFAAALVQIANSCVVGLPCNKHGGAVHGQEAEELRAGIEKIRRQHGDQGRADYEDFRSSLQRLLDEIDARDSLAFREAADPADTGSTSAP